MTVTSRALIAVLAMSAFTGCDDGESSTSGEGDGSTTADDSGQSPTTDDPTTDDPTTDDPTTGDPTTGSSTGGAASSTGFGSTGTGGSTSGGGSTGDTDDGGTTGGESTDSEGTGSTGAQVSSGTTGDEGGTQAVCGDGVLDLGEECDDGPDNDDTAACTSSCTAATCGDGFTQFGVEACDDGDADDLDACHNDCTAHEVVQLALGSDFSCARFDSGQVKCWGHGASGRLGYGNLDSIGDDEKPSTKPFIPLGETRAQDVVAAASHACAAFEDGTARCWGAAGSGQLGYGTMIPIGDNETAASVEPIAFGAPVSLLGSGDGAFHSCAALDSGAVKCWGQAASGKLGIVGQVTNIGDNEPLSATPTTDVGATVKALTTGQSHTCAMTSTGTVRCWGSNASAALGYGVPEDVGDDETPAEAGDVPLSDTVTDLATGWAHNCVVLDGGDVQCWGRGNDGRLGYGDTLYVGYGNTPADKGIVNLDGPAREVAAGLAHSCALLMDGTVQCWGSGTYGQLGYGDTESIGDDETPADAGVVPLAVEARAIEAGGNHTCVITTAGGVRCWGQGTNGRLGYGTTDHIGDDESLVDLGDVPLLPH